MNPWQPSLFRLLPSGRRGAPLVRSQRVIEWKRDALMDQTHDSNGSEPTKNMGKGPEESAERERHPGLAGKIPTAMVICSYSGIFA